MTKWGKGKILKNGKKEEISSKIWLHEKVEIFKTEKQKREERKKTKRWKMKKGKNRKGRIEEKMSKNCATLEL